MSATGNEGSDQRSSTAEGEVRRGIDLDGTKATSGCAGSFQTGFNNIDNSAGANAGANAEGRDDSTDQTEAGLKWLEMV